jgi:L-rhamnose mutarotase
MERMGLCIGVKPEHIARYRELHADVWPDVLAVIRRANIRNYSIFLREPENLLFAYWEYHGTDFEADSAGMLNDPAMVEWWKVCTPLQRPLESRVEGEWWASMVEVFHLD